VIERQAGDALDRADRQRGTAEGVGGVDLLQPSPRDLHPQVAGDREQGHAVGVRVRPDYEDRVGAERPLAPRALVRAQDEDCAGVGEERAVLGREHVLDPGIEALVGLLHAAAKRQVAQHPPGDGERKGDQHDDETDLEPAWRAAPFSGPRSPACVGVLPVSTARSLLDDLGADRAFRPPAPVDAVWLVLGCHGDRLS
jgi:hypothetical protein